MASAEEYLPAVACSVRVWLGGHGFLGVDYGDCLSGFC